jgi:DeoR/GlpR family transcriptional regulator of sugar metabolism
MQILQLLQDQAGDDVSVEELASNFGVSLATMRRDLARLHAEEGVTRTYGGVSLIRPQAELSIRQRETTRSAAKDAIGECAARMVTNGDTIILDAGTTTACLAAHLTDSDNVWVITNGIGPVLRLLDIDTVSVTVLGGHLRHINQTIAGAEAEEMLRHVYAATAFIGVDAIDPELGIASRTAEQSRLKTLMMRRAQQVVILADSTKLTGGYFPHWSPLDLPWQLVTDDEADDSALELAREAGATQIHTCRAVRGPAHAAEGSTP